MEKPEDSKNNELICLPESSQERVVIIGGGFAGITLARKLKKAPYQVVLLDRNNFHQFQPLLYQVATCGLEPDSIVFPFRKMFNHQKNFSFRLAEVARIDPSSKSVITDKGLVYYDYLVIATGSRTNYFGLVNVRENSTGMKDVREALNIRHLMLQNLEKAAITCDESEKAALTNFIIVGGGPAGVEMAGALAEFKKFILPQDYPELKAETMNIFLIEATDRVLNSMSTTASEKSLKYLQNLCVTVKLNTAVESYDGVNAKMKDGETKAATMIWTAGVKATFPAGTGNAKTARGGRLEVDEFLQVKGYDRIFAAGDVAAMTSKEYPQGHPMVAQPAIQQGRSIAANLINLQKGKPMKKFVYKDKGSLATIGKKKAVADIKKFHFGGYLAWIIWSVVHLLSIIGFRNRLFVALNWLWSYFSYEKSNRLIIRKYEKQKNLYSEESGLGV